MEILSEGVLLGLGQPLLDMVLKVDSDFLTIYELKSNNGIHATMDLHNQLYKVVSNHPDLKLIPGGTVYNTLKVVQWILGQPKRTVFIGSIGNDENGKTLINCCDITGINSHFQIISNEPTGICLVLLTNDDRSLCTFPGVSNSLTKEFIQKPRSLMLLDQANFFYISMFYLVKQYPLVQQIVEYACARNRCVVVNLGASFIMTEYIDEICKLLPFVDLIFGNASEFQHLAQALTLKTHITSEIGKYLANFSKINSSHERLVIVTDGKDVVTVIQGHSVQEFPVIQVPLGHIKSTNGAGDAFVGGFLSQYIQMKPLEQCIKCAIWMAARAVQGLEMLEDTEINWWKMA